MITAAAWASPFAPGDVDVESLSGRVVAEMPFTHRRRFVAAGLERLGEGDECVREHRRIFRRDDFSQYCLAAI